MNLSQTFADDFRFLNDFSDGFSGSASATDILDSEEGRRGRARLSNLVWSLSQAGASASDPALIKLLSTMVKATCHLFDSQRFVHLIYYYTAVVKALPNACASTDAPATSADTPETISSGNFCRNDVLGHLANVARVNKQHFSSKELSNILCTYGDWIDCNRTSFAYVLS